MTRGKFGATKLSWAICLAVITCATACGRPESTTAGERGELEIRIGETSRLLESGEVELLESGALRTLGGNSLVEFRGREMAYLRGSFAFFAAVLVFLAFTVGGSFPSGNPPPQFSGGGRI